MELALNFGDGRLLGLEVSNECDYLVGNVGIEFANRVPCPITLFGETFQLDAEEEAVRCFASISDRFYNFIT